MAGASTVVDKTIARMIGSGHFNGITLSAYRESDASQFHFSGGALDFRSPFFATSTSQLYVTAIVMQLRAEGKIALDTPFTSYLEGHRFYRELHVKDGVDSTEQITIRHLMSQTSGLSDTLLSNRYRRNVNYTLMNCENRSWTFDDTIARTRSVAARSRPGLSRRATFSEVNFQILGVVIESIEGKSFGEVLKARITQPLGLTATYLYTDPSDERPLNLIAHKAEVKVPRSIVSLGAGSAVVTTSREALIFLRAYFEGYLFDQSKVKDLYDWRSLLYPCEYGVGMMRLKMPRVGALRLRLREPSTVFQPTPELYGHIGGGCSSFVYAPKLGIYVAGTTNNLCDPLACCRLVLRTIEAIHGAKMDSHLRGTEFGVSRYGSRNRIAQKEDHKAPDWAPKRPFGSIIRTPR
jgi:CubicO group peptidase (beta-lactamase class C family)